MSDEQDEQEPEQGTPGGGDNAARLARLARKAESARLARLRHKQFVQDKQAEVQALQNEEATLLADEEPASAAALETVRQELRKALTQDQMQLLGSWLCESPGGAPVVETYLMPNKDNAPPLNILPAPGGVTEAEQVIKAKAPGVPPPPTSTAGAPAPPSIPMPNAVAGSSATAAEGISCVEHSSRRQQ